MRAPVIEGRKTEGLAREAIDITTADFFQVLSSPIRLAVVRLLLERERVVSELMEELGIAQSRLSNHLACLRNCGFATARREGSFVFYGIADPQIGELLELAERMALANAPELASCEVIQQER
jgi:ArsR family transcriptional regulator, cadmium/lead-responsive transcriptional repressor